MRESIDRLQNHPGGNPGGTGHSQRKRHEDVVPGFHIVEFQSVDANQAAGGLACGEGDVGSDHPDAALSKGMEEGCRKVHPGRNDAGKAQNDPRRQEVFRRAKDVREQFPFGTEAARRNIEHPRWSDQGIEGGIVQGRTGKGEERRIVDFDEAGDAAGKAGE